MCKKMCLKVPEGEKLQKTPYFPDGWKFGFTTVASRNVQWNGFLLVAPPSDGEQRFRSIGRAIKQMHLLKLQDLANNAKLFYQHVGLDGVPDTKLEALSNETIDGAGSIGKPPDQPSDGKDLQRCGPTSIEISHDLRSSSHREQSVRKQHVYSTKKELGARVYAKFSNDEWYWGMVTKVIHGNPIAGFPKFSVCSKFCHWNLIYGVVTCCFIPCSQCLFRFNYLRFNTTMAKRFII